VRDRTESEPVVSHAVMNLLEDLIDSAEFVELHQSRWLVDIDSCPFERRHFHHVGDADVGELKHLHCRVGLFVL